MAPAKRRTISHSLTWPTFAARQNFKMLPSHRSFKAISRKPFNHGKFSPCGLCQFSLNTLSKNLKQPYLGNPINKDTASGFKWLRIQKKNKNFSIFPPTFSTNFSRMNHRVSRFKAKSINNFSHRTSTHTHLLPFEQRLKARSLFSA